MEPDLEHSLTLLARFPATLDAVLRGLPDAFTLGNEGPGTWSPFEVVGHLVHCERVDFMTRVGWILEHGETRAFEPLDRQGHEGAIQGKSTGVVLDEFARFRAENVKQLRALGLRDEDLARRGLHPSLGSVTLSQLLATWAAHDLNHLHQISRILAHPYRDAVGPWSRYLGVMQCAGHSASA